MWRGIPQRVLLLAIVLSGPAVVECSERRPPKNTKIAIIIDSLESRNPVPRLRNPVRSPLYGEGYRHEENERVAAILRRLFNAPVDVSDLDELADHFDDSRFAVTAESPSGWDYNYTVGDCCRQLFALRVRPERRGNHFGVIWDLPKDAHKLRDWWKSVRNRGLPAIQEEWLCSALRELSAEPLKDAAEQELVVRKLCAALRHVRETGTPYIEPYSFRTE